MSEQIKVTLAAISAINLELLARRRVWTEVKWAPLADLVAPVANMLLAALKVSHELTQQDQSDASRTDGDRLRPPIVDDPGPRETSSRRHVSMHWSTRRRGWGGRRQGSKSSTPIWGLSGRCEAERRTGFREVVSRVCLGEVGAIFGLEVSRLARSSADFARLLELARLTDTWSSIPMACTTCANSTIGYSGFEGRHVGDVMRTS